MKKILTTFLLILFCFSLTSCSAIEALKYSVSGDIIDPADGFSRGEEGTLLYKNNKYILVQELSGDCEIDITKEDILLGRRSNFPIFPDSCYYAKPDENPSFIMNGSTMQGTVVYLREDLYSDTIVYVLNGSSFEFEFTTAFIKTDTVNYDHHIAREKYTKSAKVNFYVKDIPIITARKRIYLIDNVWYCVEVDVAYQLSDEFVSKLIEEGIINQEP
ncbi:MAG: hypothetical protein IKJ04_03595 [Clostridia bacterium]|nr:hypothetical protein [Clostridia bacterium]MBR4033870.1 hypothetical protein [Clostridia bacterium]